MPQEYIVGLSLFLALVLVFVFASCDRNNREKIPWEQEEKKPIGCPTCGCEKTRYLSMSEAPFQRFSTPMQCQNGHVFNEPETYSDGYMYE